MSYMTLATDRFDEVAQFYGELLGFPVVRGWDRPNGRGRVFDAHGLRLEILDASREPRPMVLSPPGDRVHVVVEVPDIEAVQRALPIDTPAPLTTHWGTRLFQIRDPDGVAVWFMQWLEPSGPGSGSA